MYKTIMTIIFALILTWGCAKQVAKPETSTLPTDSVKTIAVLPVVASPAADEAKSPQAIKQLQPGIETLSLTLSDYFAGNQKVTLLNNDEVDSHVTSYNDNQLDQALAIGKNLKAEAILLLGVKRFHERIGNDYSVQAPASVAFDYRLVHTESGQTLCSGSFDETQKSITDNLLSLKNLVHRGFKWITAADLAKEGVTKELADCKYLQ